MKPASGKPANGTKGYYICGFICVALSLFCILPAQYEINSAKKAMHWLPKKAKITDSRVVSTTTYGDNRRSTNYRAEIKGVWVEDQRPFEIERIFFAQIQDRSIVEQTVKEYPPGKVVTVFVAPDDPSRVILKKDVSLTSMYWLQAVGVCFIIAALIIFSEARKIKTPTPVL